MNIEQEREAFKKHYGALFDLTETPDAWGNPRFAHESVEAIWYGWRDRAALQSQHEIDEARLSIVLDVYDNAMQKAFEGREFPNPCEPNTPEHLAWEMGTKEGKDKREAGLPNSIALQSKDWDAERYRWLLSKLQQSYDGEDYESDSISIYSRMASQYKGDRSIQAEVFWRDKADEPIALSEAIDHACRVEEKT